MTDPKVERYFKILKKIKLGLEPTDDDIKFYISTTPDINQDVIDQYVDEQRKASKDPKNFTVDPDLSEAAVVEVGRMLQSDPIYKEQTVKILKDAEKGKLSDKLAAGINLVLAGTDIANSINQIRASDSAAKKSRRPTRPSIPQRDIYLQQALRNAEEGTFDAARATAPLQAQIQDQYLSDVQDAKTAATGQAGAYGAYRQLAANRRNRAALNIAPIQDEIRRGQQTRYDNLLGMRLDETQNMSQNQASLYPSDLNQYNTEQEAAARVGAAGRLNLRDSLYNLGSQAASSIADLYTNRRYRKLYNQALASGVNPDHVAKAEQNLRGYYGTMTSDDTPNYWEQIY